MEALAEEAKNVGIESEKTDLTSVEQAPVKKKVKIVKKIVKKKVIKKVPKRVSIAPNSNLIETIANPNDNAPMEVEELVPVEIEKHNVVNDLREVENMKEFQVTEKGMSVEVNDSCRDDSEKSGLVTLSSLGDQNQIELRDREIDSNNMDDSEKSGLVTPSSLGDQNQIELRDREIDSNNMDAEGHEGEERVKEQDEKIELVTIEGGSSNDVKREEGMKEQVDKTDNIDFQLTDASEEQEGVRELVENSETDCLRAEQDSHERRAPGCERAASGWYMKQRTKIFIHGLDKETKEEDIREVFQEVGEVVEVKIITNLKTGKSRGFGFVRYASADLAELALTKYHSVKICGRLCHTAAIEGNDTILLLNIDKKWNIEYVLALLQKIGIKKINEVSVVADPENSELNRGFAYLEFETKRDAQMAYHKLQNKNVFGKHSKIKVAWAEPSADPVEEEMHDVKSVYAEHIPASWDEEEVRDQFKIFGEIESIALAKNLRTAKRNDFAFINYKTREAALSCIESLTCKQSNSDNDPKAHLKVSLAKSLPKGKPIKTMSEPAVTVVSRVKQQPDQGRYVYNKNMKVSSISRHEDSRKVGGSSTTAELVQLLREQASWKLGGSTPTTGMSTGQHHQPPYGGKQRFTELGSKSSYHDPRAYHPTHLRNPNVPHPRQIVNGVSMPSFHAHYTTGSFNLVTANPVYFQTRDQATYPGSSSTYRQMQ